MPVSNGLIFVQTFLFGVIPWCIIILVIRSLVRARRNNTIRKEYRNKHCSSFTHELSTLDQKAIQALNQNKVPLSLCTLYNNGQFLEESEALFFEQANGWASKHGYVLFSKVRIADIIHISSLDKYQLNRTIFRAMALKHFDFVLFRPIRNESGKINLIPKLIIEIDGLSHYEESRRERDQFIDTLITKYNLQKKHLMKLILIHIGRQSVYDSNTLWGVIRCVQNGYEEVDNSWMTTDMLLSSYTGVDQDNERN